MTEIPFSLSAPQSSLGFPPDADHFHLLLVEDNPVDCMVLRTHLARLELPYELSTAGSIREAKRRLATGSFDALLLDMGLPDGFGLELMESAGDTPVVVITGSYDLEVATQAFKNGAADYLVKDEALNHLKMLPLALERAISARRKRAELSRSQRLFQQAFEDDAAGKVLLSLQGRFLKVNRALCSMLGYSETALLAGGLELLCHPEDHADCGEKLAAVLEGSARSISLEKRCFHRGGRELRIALDLTLVRDADGTPAAGVVQIQDVSERRATEEALKASEDRFRSAMHHSPIGMAIAAIDGGWVEVNSVLCRMVGYTADELLARDFQSITHPDDLDGDLAFVRRMLAREIETYRMEKRYLHKDGHAVWVQLHVSLIWEADGRPRHFVSQVEDIGARKQAEAARRENEAKRALAMDLAALAYWEYDAETQRFTADENLFKLYGTTTERAGGPSISAEDYIGKFVAPEDAGAVAAEIAAARAATDPRHTRQLEHRVVRADGSVGVMMTRLTVEKDAAGRTIKAYGANQDITEAKRLEAQHRALEVQLRHSQKLEAIGTLTSGIAHEFNNMLSAIMGNLQLAEMELSAGHALRPFLREAVESSRRARDLISQLQTFGQQSEARRAPARLEPVIESAVRLLRASLPASIEIETDLPESCPTVLCDVARINQVLMQLGVNAGHAMSERGGRLEIGLRHGEPTRAWREQHPQVGAHHTVQLSIGDSGCGMTASVQERMFDPFFTTKPQGQGSGLGLSVVYGIVQRHGGAIVVDSEPGAGTTVHLFFPAAEELDPAESAPGGGVSMREGAGAQGRGAGQRILVVDDDSAVLAVIGRTLENAGYRAETHAHPSDAFARFQREPGIYAALVTDFTMPTMNGLDLAKALRARVPDLPVVLASGSLHERALRETPDPKTMRLLKKPYELTELVSGLQAVLRKN